MLSRRSIQKLLDLAVGSLSKAQLSALGKRLDFQQSNEAISGEWELIIFSALRKVGIVTWEKDFGDRRRPDISFESAARCFRADVRAVSDVERDAANPVKELQDALRERIFMLKSEGIQGSFRLSVDESFVVEDKIKLRIPSKKDLGTIFDGAFEAFIDSIRRLPATEHCHVIRDARAAVTIFFCPSATTSLMTHPAYNVAQHVIRNGVYSALRHKKSQLLGSGPKAAGESFGIFLCDGSSQLFRALKSVNNIPVDRIITHFLRGNPDIDFVCAVDIRHHSPIYASGPLEFVVRAWPAGSNSIADGVRQLLQEGLNALPHPTNSAQNAINELKFAVKTGLPLRSRNRGVKTTMSRRYIQFSLRAVMDLVAGRIDRLEFERIAHPDSLAILRRWIDEGRLVESLQIDRKAAEDDDALEIRFGEPDPAVTPFRTDRGKPTLR